MIASLKNYGRIARTVLGIVAGFLVLGIVGSLIMGARATSAASAQVVAQAQTIVDGSLALAFTPEDLMGPVSAERSYELTDQVRAVVIDPSDFEQVTLFGPDGTILYSTQQSLIGDQLTGEQGSIREALKGLPQTQNVDGTISVQLPLRFRSGVGGPAVVELTRPNDPVATAAGPWRTNALFLFAMFVLLGIGVFVVARVIAVAGQSEDPRAQAARAQMAPQPIAQPSRPRPAPTQQPGMREEIEARHRAEERARAAEERQTVLQEQYRTTLDELRSAQVAMTQRPSGDPAAEERALRAEAQLQSLQRQVATLSDERTEIARALEEARRGTGGDPELESRVRTAEREAMGLRVELEAVRSQRGRGADVQSELDTVNIEFVQAKDALTGATADLRSAERELDDLRNEVRALRNEEQRAAMLDDELRAAKAELESFRASHRADLVEREAEFEEKVRAAREQFQQQLEQFEESYRGQLGAREADLAGSIAKAEAQARAAVIELESMRSEGEAARAEAAGREQRLLETVEELSLARKEAEALKREIAERTVAVSQGRKEADEMRRTITGLQADLVQVTAAAEGARVEADTDRARAAELEQTAGTRDREIRSLSERVEKMTRMLDDAAAENAELNRKLQDHDARRQLELAGDSGRADIDELLRVTQERLAGQTEKLIAAEDRAKELDLELTSTRDRIEVAEGELRTHQMSEALREMHQPAAHDDGEVETKIVEDRRASTPFMRELSHDAKKSLTRIMGISQILKHKKDGKDQAQLIKQLSSYARRLDYTVADIVEADRLANGSIDLRIRRVDLEALVQRVVEESGIATEHEVQVHADPVKVRLDPQRTEQILLGLLRNADERTGAKEIVIVRLQPQDGGALITVEDPAPSSDASVSAVVRRFAEVQGGWAKVTPRDDGGTACRVFLPDASSVPAPEPELDPETVADADRDVAPELRIVVGDTPEGFEPSAEQILSQELRRLAELSSEDGKRR